MGKVTTWLACGLLALAPVAGGSVADRLLGTSFLLTLIGCLLAAHYLIGTFAPNALLFGRTARVRDEPSSFALTFDDGPDPRFTPQISRLLAERGHRATFFVLGTHASHYPQVLRQVLVDGHEIASHGFDHRLLAFSPPSRLRAQLLATEQAIAAAAGRPPVRLFRAPHGVRSPWLGHTVGRLGYRVCGWTGRIVDTAEPGVSTIVERACRHVRSGAILLLHDGDGSGRGGDRGQTVEALPAILDEAERRGLRSVSLSCALDPSLERPPSGATAPTPRGAPRKELPVLDLERHRPRRESGLARIVHPRETGDGEPLAGEEAEAEAHSD
jgi:peptidoglycan/xylan/chitin deacetylase (PgdA/CDA1 family)